FNTKQVVHHFAFGQRCLAGNAEVELELFTEVAIAAVAAHAYSLLGQFGFSNLLLINCAQNHALDPVLLALMVDQAEWAKLRDCQKAGARQDSVVVFSAAGACTWYEGCQRQTRKVVAWQEALSGEVPVGFEVRLAFIVVLQQAELDGTFLPASSGYITLPLAAGGAGHQPIGLFDLLERGGIKITPAAEAVIEPAHGLLQTLVCPM